MDGEVAHMAARHPEVIAERLRDAGFVRAQDGWVDVLVNPCDG